MKRRFVALVLALTIALTTFAGIAPQQKADAHVGWHYISSYCWNGYYRNLYAYAYYYDGWSHLFGQRYQENTWYRC